MNDEIHFFTALILFSVISVIVTASISDTADWGIKPHRLEYLLRSARDLGLQFYRYKDFTHNDEAYAE